MYHFLLRVKILCIIRQFAFEFILGSDFPRCIDFSLGFHFVYCIKIIFRIFLWKINFNFDVLTFLCIRERHSVCFLLSPSITIYCFMNFFPIHRPRTSLPFSSHHSPSQLRLVDSLSLFHLCLSRMIFHVTLIILVCQKRVSPRIKSQFQYLRLNEPSFFVEFRHRLRFLPRFRNRSLQP